MTVLDYYKVADKNYYIEFYGPNEHKYYGCTLNDPGIVEYLQNCEIKKITKSFNGRTKIVICEPVAEFTFDNPIHKRAVNKIREYLVRKGEAEVLELIPTKDLKHFAYLAVGYKTCGDLDKKARNYVLKHYSKQIFEYLLKQLEVFYIDVALVVAKTDIEVGWPDYE